MSNLTMGKCAKTLVESFLIKPLSDTSQFWCWPVLQNSLFLVLLCDSGLHAKRCQLQEISSIIIVFIQMYDYNTLLLELHTFGTVFFPQTFHSFERSNDNVDFTQLFTFQS